MSIVRGEICAQNNYPTRLNRGSLVFRKLVVNPRETLKKKCNQWMLNNVKTFEQMDMTLYIMMGVDLASFFIIIIIIHIIIL